jgi:hypothetical protein
MSNEVTFVPQPNPTQGRNRCRSTIIASSHPGEVKPPRPARFMNQRKSLNVGNRVRSGVPLWMGSPARCGLEAIVRRHRATTQQQEGLL